MLSALLLYSGNWDGGIFLLGFGGVQSGVLLGKICTHYEYIHLNESPMAAKFSFYMLALSSLIFHTKAVKSKVIMGVTHPEER